MRRASVKVVDLFSGVGGLSLGAVKAGFKVALAVDTDPITAVTHKQNFPQTAHSKIRVENLSSERIKNLARIEKSETWGLIGGPPCQGFSLIGKRELADERNLLFAHFFRLVKEAAPTFFLVENVPGILDQRYRGLRQQALEHVPKTYTVLDPITVCASDYGAPTTRTRVLFIGYDRSRMSPFNRDLFTDRRPDKRVTVEDALKGLPKKVFDESAFAWRRLLDTYEGSYAHQLSLLIPKSLGFWTAVDRFQRSREVSGCIGTTHTLDVCKRFAKIDPGEYDAVSNAIRLQLSGLCPTLRAGTGKEHGSFQSLRPIHPTEDRVITPREAARLQGFPDWFYFHPTKWHSFRQIGNSVSPIVAEAILKAIASQFRSGD